jgi:outer membrane protein assembly factor BamA
VSTDGNAAEPRAAARRHRDRRTASRAPTVDVTMRLSEGKQFFVNRISFIGNTTTRDNVIRREMRLLKDRSSTPSR